jgi:hypothetical protein
MIFANKKILVWCDDPPEDPVISIFAGCLPNHDHTHSLILFRDDVSSHIDIICFSLYPIRTF